MAFVSLQPPPLALRSALSGALARGATGVAPAAGARDSPLCPELPQPRGLPSLTMAARGSVCFDLLGVVVGARERSHFVPSASKYIVLCHLACFAHVSTVLSPCLTPCSLGTFLCALDKAVVAPSS